MMYRLVSLAVFMFVLATPALAQSGTLAFVRATARIEALAAAIRDVPGGPPALAVVMVRRGATPHIVASGIADTRTARPAGKNTAFYIGSMTKAYVGLLAVEMDRQGVLDLDTSLASIWPDARIDGVDLARVSLRDGLAHRLPFSNDVLSFNTAYTNEIAADQYARLLTSASTPKAAGFEYDNLGYLLYGAALEKRTGRSWKDWLREAVLRPLKLRRTFSTTSAIPDLTAAHRWDGENWQAQNPKVDALMHAAGGLLSSPADIARWLEAYLGATTSLRNAVTIAHVPVSYPPADRGGRMCDGYSFGWHHCGAYGMRILEHGGTYTGFRSHMMVAPEAGIGIAILTNSDGMTGDLASKLMLEFLRAFSGSPSDESAVAFARSYADRVAEQAANRFKRNARQFSASEWSGWLWDPAVDALARYAGKYSGLDGTVEVRLGGKDLIFVAGARRMRLVPAAPGVFGAVADPLDPLGKVRFSDDAGVPQKLEWDGRGYLRVG